MIKSKADLKYYLEQDRIALYKSSKKPRIAGDEIWRYEILLRKTEYFLNCKKSKLGKAIAVFYHYRQRIGSIMHAADVKRYVELWDTYKDGFDSIETYLSEKQRRKMIYDCSMCAYKLWAEVARTPRRERKLYEKKLREIAEVNRRFYSEIRGKKYSLYVKLIFLLTSHANGCSYSLLITLYSGYSVFLKKDQFSGGELFD